MWEKVMMFLRGMFGMKSEIAEAVDAVIDAVEEADDVVDFLSEETEAKLDAVEAVVEQYCDEGDKA